MSVGWNPWHGCERISEGCRNCYVFRIDASHGKTGGSLRLNSDFLLPLKEGKNGFRIPAGETVYTCFSSDFLLEEADKWREDAWRMMRIRSDLQFVFFTKRILRLAQVLPKDWGDGYANVTIGCTCENQARADERLPTFLSLPIAERMIVCEPMLSAIDLRPYLDPRLIRSVCAGGESGDGARVCDFEWIKQLSDACKAANVDFHYHQTGALLQRDGRLYKIPRRLQQLQAKKANVDYHRQKSFL
jgi:protein gp37